MIVHIRLVTVDFVTVEVNSKEEAQERAAVLARERNESHHHGELTTAQVVADMPTAFRKG